VSDDAGPFIMDLPAPWITCGVSLIGSSHLGTVLPCQDSVKVGADDTGRWAWLIAADGHGSAPYFRSDRGSRIAVQVLYEMFESIRIQVEQVAQPLLEVPEGAELEGMDQARVRRLSNDFVQNLLVRKVLSGWRERVAADLAADPPRAGATEGPLDLFLEGLDSKNPGSSAVLKSRLQEWSDNPDTLELPDWGLRAYGSTLLGVLVGPAVLYWFQLGDGAMARIDSGTARYLVSPPPEAFGNETPSLCGPDAVDQALAGVFEFVGPMLPPEAIVISTDGIINSYTDSSGFFSFAEAVAQRSASDLAVGEKLELWLNQISAGGSGDDVTLALAFHSSPSVSYDNTHAIADNEGAE